MNAANSSEFPDDQLIHHTIRCERHCVERSRFDSANFDVRVMKGMLAAPSIRFESNNKNNNDKLNINDEGEWVISSLPGSPLLHSRMLTWPEGERSIVSGIAALQAVHDPMMIVLHNLNAVAASLNTRDVLSRLAPLRFFQQLHKQQQKETQQRNEKKNKKNNKNAKKQ